MKKYSKTSIFLNIYTNDFSPQIVDNYINIDGIVMKNDKGSITEDGILLKVSSWKCKIFEFNSYLMEENLNRTIEILKENKSQIKELIKRDFDISIDIVTYKVKNDSVGIDIPTKLMEVLADLKIGLLYNVYDK